MSKNHKTKLASMDWPWKAENRAGSIILVSDDQFTNLAQKPDEAVEKPAPWFEKPVSLGDYCRDLAESGATKIHIAFDYFFGGSGRSLYPDTVEFQENLKRIHDVAAQYDLGIEPSILSPLELGVGYREKTGECGRWMQYAEGMRDPQTGKYSVMVWKHRQWVNNKGPTPVELVHVRAFAFREKIVPDTQFFSVDRKEIIELPEPMIEEYPGTRPIHYGAPEVGENPERQFQANRVRIYGEGQIDKVANIEDYERVLVVLIYNTLEMDYFSTRAEPFVLDLVQSYHDRGMTLAGVYSDEMHIQQDWIYHHHMDYGQFTLRYVSPGFERAFAAEFGEQYADFAPWLVYFTCHQHHFLATHEPNLPNQHVFGPSPQEIASTQLLRRNYYHFLENRVIDLMLMGFNKLEALQGTSLDAFYHATWAESPTCDLWSVGGVQKDWTPEEHRRKYEYTPEFTWSNTIQQAAAACANYFAWNEFLTGGNNDIPEGGYADRNYYGRAMAASLAALNRQPLASCGMWGMPAPVAERMHAVSEVYGVGGHPIFRSVEDYTARQVEVLFLYPQDLVAVEERFGSWMVQYGYANYITAEKLLQYGEIDRGWLAVKGSHYRAICVLFEPFPSRQLMSFIMKFAESGGIVVWSGIPPKLFQNGELIDSEVIRQAFGVEIDYSNDPYGYSVPGRSIFFNGSLDQVSEMPVLTDFVVDRVHPVTPVEDCEAVAWYRPGGNTPERCVGVLKRFPSGGQSLYLGFRPRDDQSASTGNEQRTWFEILERIGAYPGSERSAQEGVATQNDNPVVISRKSDFLASAFSNGARAVSRHFRLHEENWQGGFFRDAEQDKKALSGIPLNTQSIELTEFRMTGQTISYKGEHCLAWRLGEDGHLLAFAGLACEAIVINGIEYRWSTSPVHIAWHPMSPGMQVEGYKPLYRVWLGSVTDSPQELQVRIPLNLDAEQNLEMWAGASLPLLRQPRGRLRSSGLMVGYGDRQIPFNLERGSLVLDLKEDFEEHWLYLVERK